MSLIPTPPAMKLALKEALDLERRAKIFDNAITWETAMLAWKAVANLARGSS